MLTDRNGELRYLRSESPLGGHSGIGKGSRPSRCYADTGTADATQRDFLVARFRGGVNRSAIVAIAEGTRR